MNKIAVLTEPTPFAERSSPSQSAPADWRRELPVLIGRDVLLREVEVADAGALSSLLTSPEITRFISTPPSSVEGFERFIVASRHARAAGEGACFAVTLRGYDTAIGLFQVRQISAAADSARQLSGAMDTAEWGFAIGSPFWGSGVFEQGARLVVAFAFEQLRVRRLEARAAVQNGRGGRALRKMGAVAEGVLRKAMLCSGEWMDQALYTILESDWRRRVGAAGLSPVH